MSNTSKDLFDDSSMSFGEHLEVLRTHLIRAIIGLVICVIGCLFYGEQIVAMIRLPIDKALRDFDVADVQDDIKDAAPPSWWEWVKKQSGLAVLDLKDTDKERRDSIPELPETGKGSRTIEVKLLPSDLANALHGSDPQHYPKPAVQEHEKPVTLRIAAPEFSQLERVIERTSGPITLNVQEAFMMYMKVACIAGLILASPWVLYQLWLFVAAGLYPHERKYVYIYLPMSIFLFLGGCIFCFYCVFPFMLNFLLSFNRSLGLQPQIRMSEWISFAVTLPLVFGISFELPLVMLFLERITVFDVKAYREKRRMAILVISFLSMMLTPSADPMSMILMLVPMLCLYEFGILLCLIQTSKTPFAGEPATT